ncbi:UNVERIFIED_CONTAM: hypothetical protein PYX00_001332 [Menopon gallinae]|uniref:Uncharacterized protein n=1 Tax=Menopon gallinae TaxID=328185 RepID=A0AAW2ID69_9NEOP
MEIENADESVNPSGAPASPSDDRSKSDRLPLQNLSVRFRDANNGDFYKEEKEQETNNRKERRNLTISPNRFAGIENRMMVVSTTVITGDNDLSRNSAGRPNPSWNIQSSTWNASVFPPKILF